MVRRYNVGDHIRFNDFAYHNLKGGTTLVDDIAEGVVIYEFWDEECGQRLHVKLDKEYFEKYCEKTKENKFYVSQFDVLEKEQL